MTAVGTIEVEVVYAMPESATVIRLTLAEGATVGDALTRSGVGNRHPELDLQHAKVGIYGRTCTHATRLRDHDRVEIYRPLQADPKDARRRRAERAKRTR